MEEVYFGSARTLLCSACGVFHRLNDAVALVNNADMGNLRVQATFLDRERADTLAVVVPAPPFPQTTSAFVSCCTSLCVPPEVLSFVSLGPLIKRSEVGGGTDGLVQGLQSGCRSAIVKFQTATDGPVWLRMKGCGDGYRGFHLEPLPLNSESASGDATAKPESLQVRGCMFENTCLCEQIITCEVRAAALKSGSPFVSANDSIGWFEYSSTEHPIPSIKKCCGLFITKGERRLSDHILVGIEEMLPMMVGNLGMPDLIQLFPPERLLGNFPRPSIMPVISRKFHLLANTFGIPLVVNFPTDSAKIDTISQWKATWEHRINGKPHVLTSLYWRLGREVGTILRTLHDNGLSWGTYTDDLGFHCNAHTNNLVAVYKRGPGEYFLAPLDFDMAFTEKSWRGCFQEVVSREKYSMMLSLVSDCAHHATLDGPFLVLKWCLRDTLVSGFLSAYNKQEDEHPITPTLESDLECLLRLALIKTGANKT
ncbi:Adenylyltransferase and sulfurtransferase MOCS3-1 [Pelomyxa schiedti]|nr:Adenylyltransferase and sulfurtransferase MOCS3-1 [Pelomyxa schiedti]